MQVIYKHPTEGPYEVVLDSYIELRAMLFGSFYFLLAPVLVGRRTVGNFYARSRTFALSGGV